ncbi:MAG: hypothetical protein ACP5PX_06260 [Candidatus Hadarchaeum sp.]|uniref:hypothetical protein n=1 Tax=Candidatus Hadarchaeum sp. TaxID=2883567 RepID=UPI003D0C6263
MRKFIPTISALVLAILAFFCLTWGFYYEWPDYVHVDYGVPLTWATHTYSTIIGPPAAPWRVDISALQMDLIFWLGLIVLATFVGKILARSD